MAHALKLSDADHAQVSAAVHAAEATTAGEIVTVVTRTSDTYSDVALWWSAFIALSALGMVAAFSDFYVGLLRDLTGGWWSTLSTQEALELALIIAALKFAGTWVLLLWRPLRRLLTPRFVQRARVRTRAIQYFKLGAERRTAGRTGVLIYASLEERLAEIVADESIHAKVPDEAWGAAMAGLVAQARQGQLAAGMVTAVRDVGAILAAHFPRAADDQNELPDRLIEL